MKRRLDELANIAMGQSPSSEFYNANRVGTPFLQGCTTFGRIYPKYDTWTTSFNKEANPGDVLFTVRAPVGDVNICKIHTAIGRGLAALSAKTVLSKYLFYLLQANKSLFMSSSSGTIYQSINKDKLGLVELTVHSDEEQQHIVGTIGSVDSLIEKNEETIDKANNIIGHYFEIIPVVSTTTKLKDVFQITIGRTPPTKEHQWFSNGGLGSVPWLSIKDMDSNTTFLTKTSQYLTEEAVERFNIPLVEENDVLLSFKLTVGRVEISSIRMVTNEAIACFKADAYLRNYLYCYLKKCNFLSDGDNTSSIGQAVNSTIIKNFPFSVPTNASLAQFNEKTMPLFKLVMEKQKENILLKREKQALLIRYFGSH